LKLEEAYRTLNLSQETFSLITLKRQFKKLVMKWHPDLAKHKGIPEQQAKIATQKVIQAYELLKRKLVHQEPHSTTERPTNSNFNYSKKYTNNKEFDFSEDDLDRLFQDRIVLKSTQVKWIYYFEDLKYLIIKFKAGTIGYLYHNVPKYIYEEFINSESPGKFANRVMPYYAYKDYSYLDDWKQVLILLKKHIIE